MSDGDASWFGLDPRRSPSQRGDWENVGRLNDLNMADFISVVNREHQLGLNKHSSILEVGLGEGRLFKRLIAEGYDVTGVESRKRKEHTAGLPVAHIRIEEMPFGQDRGTFEIVIAASVFDSRVYKQDPRLMISRIAEALSPGGIFISTSFPLLSDDFSAVGLERLYLPTPYDGNVRVYRKVRSEASIRNPTS